MKSIWNGTISFGMAVIPVKLGSAAGQEELPLHEVRASDGSRVQYKRFAVADGKAVEYADMAKGYELPDGRTVVLDSADFTAAYGEAHHAAEIVAFTPARALPRAASAKSYVVEPGKGGEKPYALLARALHRQDKAAVVSIALRSRQSLALLYATADGYLMLEMLNWAADVRKPDFAAPEFTADGAQLDLAENYISLMSTQGFDWASAADPSRERLEAVVQAKVSDGKAVGTPAAAPDTAPPADLTAALLASVKAEKARAAAGKASPRPRSRAPRARGTAA